MTWEIRQGDCLEKMRELDDASIDAVVCDPPYGIGFMGHQWDQPGDFGPVKKNGHAGGANGGQWSRPRRTGPADRGSVVAGSYDLSLTANRRYQAWCEAWATECFRVLKPGGHLLASCGSRTYHRLAAGVEDAGFEIRDSLIWLYGSGFPKSLDVSKAIDKAADYRLQAAVRRAAVTAVEAAGLELPGNSRHDWTIGEHAPGDRWWAAFKEWLPTVSDEDRERVEGAIVATIQKTAGWFTSRDVYDIVTAATPEAAEWQGWGTALKPSHEPIVVARKPLIGTVAANVLAHRTGAINVDGCRIDADWSERSEAWKRSGHSAKPAADKIAAPPGVGIDTSKGRWPANVALSPEAAAELDEQTGELTSGANPTRRGSDPARGKDTGGASRFFYVAKASSAERNAGLDGFDLRIADPYGEHRGRRMEDKSRIDGKPARLGRNFHPTVKPIALMRWLCRLVAPPGALILDPFGGSFTTGCAAVLEGFNFIGIEREAEYVAIGRARIAFWAKHPGTELDDVLGSDALERKHRDAGQDSLFAKVEAA